MDTTMLAPWRDLAIVLLVIEAFIMVLVPGIIVFFVIKGVRAVKRWLRPLLLNAQVWALRIQLGTTRGMNAVAQAPINVSSRATLIRATTRGVVDYLLGK